MSATGTRMTLAEADRVAADLLAHIDGEAHVVGSVRRRKPDVGDIELLVHQSASVLIDVAPGPLMLGGYETVKGGNVGWGLWQLRHREQGFHVDLYRFDDDNRGSMMLIRTGPVEYSKAFVVALRSFGLRHHDGYVVRDYPLQSSVMVACSDERRAFELAGLEWREPEARR